MWKTRLLFIDFETMEQKGITSVPAALQYVEDEMNILGEDGWEPYHVTDDDDDNGIVVWLKKYEV